MNRMPLAVIAVLALVVVGGVFLLISDSGKGGRSGGEYSADPPQVPRAYAKWITRSARQCKPMTAQLIASQLYQESRLDPNAVSPRGAVGMAQFLRGTWQTWGKDDDGNGKARRRDPGDSIMALGRMMCALTAKARRTGWKPGKVELALAAYNAGWGAVVKYRGVPPYRETRAYVEVVMALARDRVPAMPRTPTPTRAS